MLASDEVKIVVALISGLFSLLVAVVSAAYGYVLARKSQRELEELRDKLTTRRAEQDARRAYEYEARKHLYQVCEPLFFQLIESSESALNRIYGLARTARDGNLDPERSWLRREGYFLVTTAYRLFCPLAVLKLVQRRLTLVDLALDPRIEVQYRLVKALHSSLTHDFALAKEEPALPYDPDAPGARSKRQEQPEIYRRQGIYRARLDNAAEALILPEPDGVLRCLSFGEFESTLRRPGSVVHRTFAPITDLLLNFHPRRRPVFWRILVVQAYLHETLLRAAKSSPKAPWMGVERSGRQTLDWRRDRNEATDEEVLVHPFIAAEAYLQKRLGDLSGVPTLNVK